MIAIIIHQSRGSAGWYTKTSEGKILNQGFVLGEDLNAYRNVTYRAAIDALATVPVSEPIVFMSPLCRTLARKRKNSTQPYIDFIGAVSGRFVQYIEIDAESEEACYAKSIVRNISNEEIERNFQPDYIAYTDGSCNNLSPHGEGGAAYVILDKQKNIVKQNSKGFLGVTNNKMELMAILSAVASVPTGSTLLIYTDSAYCITVLTNKANANNHTRPNANVIRKYFFYASKLKDIRFRWIKGHNGDMFNEMVDALALARTEEIRSTYNIPLYDWTNSPKCRKIE